MPSPHRPPAAVRRALRTLGADIRAARQVRRLPASLLAERAFTTRPTLRRIEAGNHTVGVGIYAAVLHALGLLDGFASSASIAGDRIGLALAEARLPKCTRSERRESAMSSRFGAMRAACAVSVLDTKQRLRLAGIMPMDADTIGL